MQRRSSRLILAAMILLFAAATPFAIDITSNGEPTGSLQIETIEVNPEVEPALFTKPAE